MFLILHQQSGLAQPQVRESGQPQTTPALEALLVAGNGSDNVVQFDLATGQWTELARLPEGTRPRGIAVGNNGEIFLGLDGGKKNLAQLVPGDGSAQLKDVTAPIGRFGPGMIVFSNGRIWAAGDTERVIHLIDPATGEVSTPPQFRNLANLVGLAADGKTLYAAEYFQRSILRYDLGTEAKPAVRLVDRDPHLNRPVALAIGHNGNLYVGNGLEPTVVEFNLKSGEFIRTLVNLGAGGKDGIYGIVYVPATRRYYIASGSNLYEVDIDGNLLATYNSPALKKAYGIALLRPGSNGARTQSLAASNLTHPTPPADLNSPKFVPITTLKAVPGKLLIAGVPGERYRVMATTDFTTWEPIATLENTSGTLEFVDPQMAAMDRRFYRIEMLPETPR